MNKKSGIAVVVLDFIVIASNNTRYAGVSNV